MYFLRSIFNTISLIPLFYTTALTTFLCFLGAAITKYHKLGDLKEQKFILSQF